MERCAWWRLGRPRAGAVASTVTQDDATERPGEHKSLEHVNSVSRTSGYRIRGVQIERGLFGIGLRARCVRKCDALRDDVAHSRCDAGVDKVPGADLSKPWIAGKSRLQV